MKRTVIMFMFGGFLYGLMEVIWRGYTHPSMFAAGGICVLMFGIINTRVGGRMPVIPRCLLGGAVITAVEFLFGLVFNVWLKMNVWDYSHLPLNLMGQVCVPFFLMWTALSFVGLYAERLLRFHMLGDIKYCAPKQEKVGAIAH